MWLTPFTKLPSSQTQLVFFNTTTHDMDLCLRAPGGGGGPDDTWRWLLQHGSGPRAPCSSYPRPSGWVGWTQLLHPAFGFPSLLTSH